jgi:hypothetical protein
MSVTITTQFYNGSTWANLSKVVYTSANIPSPTTAGTRSHILPGELPLALWYEDLTNMYRRSNEQAEAATTISGTQPYKTLDTTISGFCAQNSVVFEVTSGECYDCRLTAWDDVTHTTANKFLINTSRVKVSAVAYRSSGTKQVPTSIVDVYGAEYNTTLSGNGLYYGDFNMIYANPTTGKNGDYLIFKPWLYNIDGTVTYGVHDFVITLHYSYT